MKEVDNMEEVKFRKVKKNSSFWDGKTIYFTFLLAVVFLLLYFKLNSFKKTGEALTAPNYLNAASEFESKGFYKEAISTYEKYLEMDGKRLDNLEKGNIYYKMAILAYKKLKLYRKAAYYGILAKNFLPENSDIFSKNQEYLVEVLERIGKESEAREELKSVDVKKEDFKNKKGEVVAMVKGEKIYKLEVLAAYQKLPEEVKKKMSLHDFFQQYIFKKAVVAKARAEKVDEKAQFQEKIKEIEDDLLFQTYLQNYLKSVPTLESDVKNFYLSHSYLFKEPEERKIKLILWDKDKKQKLEEKEVILPAGTEKIEGIDVDKELITEVFKLAKEGEKTPFIKSSKGFFQAELLKIKPAYLPPFEKVKGKVMSLYQQKRTEELLNSLQAQFISSGDVIIYANKLEN